MTFKYLPFITLVFLLGCADGDSKLIDETGFYTPENASDFNEKASLIASGEKQFDLDSLNTFSHYQMQFFEQPGTAGYLSFFNEVDTTLLIYSYDDGKLFKKIKIVGEGPDKVTEQMGNSFAFYVLSLDSILAFDPIKKKMILIDSESHILKKDTIPNVAGQQESWIQLRADNQPARNGNNIVFATQILDNYRKTISNPGINYNISNGSFINHYEKPAFYKNNTWGQAWPFVPTLVNVDSKFIYNFPPSPFLHIVDAKGKLTDKKFAGSKYFKAILPFNKGRELSSEEQLSQHDKIKRDGFSKPHYYRLLYDHYKDVFYRFANMGYTNEEINARASRKFSIIILDHDLKKIGETAILSCDSLDHRQVFVNPDGLHIANQNIYKESNEEKLGFTIFKLINK